jgi:AcrR family transcriptional regulator
MNSSRRYSMTNRADDVAATRDRIARAALALFMSEWYEDVTLSRIARSAGVSHQTVLNHFQSKEGVALAAIEIGRQETLAARSDASPGDVPGAITALVGEYERMGDANVRWAAGAERLGRLAAVLDEARAVHQQWIVTMFGDQLPSGARRRRTVNALHAATDVYTWKLLRRDLGLSRTETEKTMADLVVGLLQGGQR